MQGIVTCPAPPSGFPASRQSLNSAFTGLATSGAWLGWIMKIFQHVYQVACPVADRRLFQYLFVGNNAVHLETGAFLQASRGQTVAMDFCDRIIPARVASRVWTSFAKTVAAFFFFSLLHSFLFATVATEQGPRSAVIRTGEFPGIRFSSGLTICDEELRNGRWVSRYWE